MINSIMINDLKEKRSLFIYKLLMGLSFVFILAYIFNKNTDLLIWSILFLLLNNVLLSFNNLSKHIIFLLFNLTFGFFLFPRFFVTGILGYSREDYIGIYDFAFVDTKYISHILISMIISIVSFSMIYFYLINKSKIKREEIINKKGNSKNIRFYKNKKFLNSIRFIALTVFCIATIFKLIYLYNEINFVKQVGYFQSYILDRPSHFRLLNLIGDMSYASYFIYLATKPKIKNSIIVSSLFLLASFIEVFTGARNPLMLNILIVISYYLLQFNYIKINKKLIFSLGIISIVVFVLMIYIGDFRGSSSSSEQIQSDNSILKKILDFLHGQGVSASPIGYVRLYRDSIPNKPYAFGVLIDFVKLEILGKIIPALSGDYSGQTVELALGGNQLQQLLTFIVFPYEYLNQGLGLGSSFIAELDLLLGYLGIFLGSAFYGFLIFKLSNWIKSDKFIYVLFSLFIARDLFFTPRASFTYFLFNLLTETQLLTIVIVLALAFVLYRINIYINNRRLENVRI